MVTGDTREAIPGTVTANTDLAICLASSLVACNGFDPEAVADRFVEWYTDELGPVDDITRDALDELAQGASWHEAGRRVLEDPADKSLAGNGSLARCLPLAIPYTDANLAIHSMRASQITHAEPRCLYGAAILNLAVAGYLNDEIDPLATALERVPWGIPDGLRAALEADPDVDLSQGTLRVACVAW